MIKIGCWRQKIFWKKRTIKIKKVQKIISVWTYKLLYLTFVIYCIPNIHCVYVCGGRSMSTIVSLFWECLEEHMLTIFAFEWFFNCFRCKFSHQLFEFSNLSSCDVLSVAFFLKLRWGQNKLGVGIFNYRWGFTNKLRWDFLDRVDTTGQTMEGRGLS